MSTDIQAHYRSQGYRIAGDGAVEFYYVVYRTNKQTNEREICVNGLFSWSQDFHDPARTIQNMAEQDDQYRYARLGPFPNRGQAEQKAIELAIQSFGDATRYGIWGTGGISAISNSDYRQPHFR
ncbi:MAG: hypothetical protein ACREUI_01685 [Burkholderiales bacterium]